MAGHEHLRRLRVVWEKQPAYFITTCVHGRRPVLANDIAANILRAEWQGLHERHGWAVGRYVIMPDHVHFFAAPMLSSARSLSTTIGKWKEWTARRLAVAPTTVVTPFWQREFFDHLLRSGESRSEKRAYVRENPVRAGLVVRAEGWPYAGTIDFE